MRSLLGKLELVPAGPKGLGLPVPVLSGLSRVRGVLMALKVVQLCGSAGGVTACILTQAGTLQTHAPSCAMSHQRAQLRD